MENNAKEKERKGEALRINWYLYVESARSTAAFNDCILYAINTPMYICMYVAFETNPQDYR